MMNEQEAIDRAHALANHTQEWLQVWLIGTNYIIINSANEVHMEEEIGAIFIATISPVVNIEKENTPVE